MALRPGDFKSPVSTIPPSRRLLYSSNKACYGQYEMAHHEITDLKKVPLIDSHAHLSMLDTEETSLSRYFDEFQRSGMSCILDVGTKAGDLHERIALVHRERELPRQPGIYFSAGIWPSEEAIKQRILFIDELEAEIQRAPGGSLVAIGECGLDRHWNKPETGADLAGERELLEAQLDLAQGYKLPVIIHSRDAAQETLDILKNFPRTRGVIHCFSYGNKEMRAFQKLGWYISFAGNVTYKNAQTLRDALKEVDRERLLLETDSPYLAPVPHRGRAANPLMVQYQYELAAQIRAEPIETLAQRISANFAELFIQF